MENLQRRSGVLLHPTSLPSDLGIGSLGDEALAFIDVLKQTKVTLWQILPLGPTGYGDSPYAARSTFAGNELLIDLRSLAYEGFLEVGDILVHPTFSKDRIDYQAVRSFKEPLLYKAADTFLSIATEEQKEAFSSFCSTNAWWLEDYALYQVLCTVYNDSRWYSMWPKDLTLRKGPALKKATATHAQKIEQVKILQYFFFTQYREVKNYANANGISIIGDIPIFVAPDSVDAWTNTRLLKMDKDGLQTASSGVPPDAFSSDGQLWGNPVYNWEEHEKENFAWWIKRIEETLKLCDIVRIDHFRGFSAYWEIPQGETTAIKGTWVPAPGKKLLSELKQALGEDIPLIAEDLGVITEDVEELRDSNNLPGMKILQFAFNLKDGKLDTTNAYLPHNCQYNSVIYTGTHDNNTTQGWYRELDTETKDKVRRYLEAPDDQVVWQMIRVMMMSSCKYAILPMQDLLGLGSEGRMNVPSTCGQSNWSWQLSSLEIDSWRLNRLRGLIEIYGREGY
jgi:4-alpha-glucanotransferase